MPHIQTLDPHVADLIAAGEVVERPASVVKELVENAMDAGGHTITVEIQNGGMTLIRVTDDGCGMAPEDAETAFLRHATSKLRCAEDLEAIGTLGFRGEALAAISSVSRIQLLTRRQEDPLGVSLELEGGLLLEREEAGCPVGTTMMVRNLFFNTPARLKYMKKDSAEGAACFAVVHRQALSHPEVSFKFIKDGKQEMLTPGDGQLRSALYAVLGRNLALGFIPIQGSGEEDMTVSGFVSMPACCRGTRSYQYFFVNGRWVKSQTMTAALEQAYANQKMVGKFPGCVIHLTTRLNAVDVNVHPTKQEVRFSRERQVFSAVYHAVLSALDGDQSHPTVQVPVRKSYDEVTERQVMLPLHDGASARVSFGAKPVSPSPVRSDVSGIKKQEAKLRLDFWQNRTVLKQPEAPEKTGQKPKEEIKGAPVPASSVPEEKMIQRGVDIFPDDSETEYLHSNVEPVETSAASKPASCESGLNRPSSAKHHKKFSTKEAKPVEKIEPIEQEEQKEQRETAAQTEWKLTPPSRPEPEQAEEEVVPWRVAGELFRTYIVVEQGTRSLLIDKHAAHERMNFDRMRAENYEPMSQELLTPVVFTPAPEEAAVLLDHLEDLEPLGFDVNDFGGGSLAVRRVPDYVSVGDVEATLSEVAGKLITLGTAEDGERRDELLHTMACKAAIKGGWKSAPEELERVARAVMSGQVKYCPHGRPVAIEISRSQLEKQFKRS